MDKIKQIIKRKVTRIATVFTFLLMISTALWLTGCTEETAGTYHVTVVTEGGKALEKVGIRVYKDASKEDLETVAISDKDGKASFESDNAMGQVIELRDVPVGYKVEECYEITSMNIQIVLKAELLSEEKLTDVTFELGSVFADLSVEATDGKVYTISELLKEKQAVILNFWYTSCGPCKMEFPYLQEAYEAYQDKIEVIALNPMDGTKENISEFQQDMGLTFPMAPCDMKWESLMQLTAYPTTVVIDRYGTIAFIHKGCVTETESFTTMFDYFVAEDYKQTTVRNLKDIMEKEE